ncbi:MAG: hypothetical protein GY814_18750, partial [Gammaproteobacteria bacterium]|nr:hypothetical protein [Gammaproteobacteria bacterium]
MGIELSRKDRMFADRYFGGPDNCRGNAKRCWLYFHPRVKERSAEELGSRTLRKVEVRQYLESKAQKLRDKTEINAQWVLEESVRLYKMAMGEIPVIHERNVEKQDENGNTYFETEYYELRKTDLRAALRALWL